MARQREIRSKSLPGPLLSVHLTTFRRMQSGLLQHAVNSVLAQSFTDFELIICDDASYDGTQSYLAAAARKDKRVKVFRNAENVNSVAVSLGRCMQRAHPEAQFITWMFDDCVLGPKAFEILVEASRDEEIDVVFGPTRVVLADGGHMLVGDRDPSFITSQIEVNATLVPNAGILIRPSVFDRVGWYDSNILLRRSCDWDLFARMFRADVAVKRVPEVLCEEFGDLQGDSLRSSFFTTYEIMKRYREIRDSAGWRLDLDAVLGQPPDSIPSADWSESELQTIYYMFVEYFLSIGNVERACYWAKGLKTKGAPFFFENLKYRADADGTVNLAAAALAGLSYYYLRMARPRLGVGQPPAVLEPAGVALYPLDSMPEFAKSLLEELLTRDQNHPRPAALISSLGYVEGVEILGDSKARVWGWGVLNRDGPHKDPYFLVLCANRIVAAGSATISRPDVARLHAQPTGVMTGFDITFPLLDPDASVRVVMFGAGGLMWLPYLQNKARPRPRRSQRLLRAIGLAR